LPSSWGSVTDASVLQVVFQSDGTGFAPVEIHGDLCAGTVEILAGALTSLIEDGATTIGVDLDGLRLCTSHGFDLFDQVHARLRGMGGSLFLTRPRGAVARVLDTLRDADPRFHTPVLSASVD